MDSATASAAIIGGVAGLYFLIQSYFVFEVLNDAAADHRGELHAPDGD